MIAAAPQQFVPQQSVPQHSVSREIRSFVGAFIWRRRRVALLRSIGWAIAFAVAWLILGALADRIFHLDRGIRSALLATNLAGILILLRPAVARMFRSRIDWTAGAAQIEARGGRFGGRLQTITSQMLADPVYRGSEQLLAHIRDELGVDLRRGDAAALAPLRAAAPSWATAAGLLLLLALSFQVSWLQMPRLLERALEPWALVPPVTTTTLWIQPGDAEIRAGSDLAISVRAARLGDDPPMLWISSDDGRSWQGQAMVAASDRFALTLGAVENDLKYFVRGGDAQSDRFVVRVLRPPAVTQFRIHYVYPAYTAKPPLSVTNTDGLIEAPVGSTASLAVICTMPLTAATLMVGDRPIVMSPTSQPNVRQCEVAVQRDEKLQLQLIGERISGSGPATMAIHALPDLPPVVKFITPTGDLRLGPRDTLPVTALATDDYGVTSVGLRGQVNRASPVDIPMPLDGPPKYCRGTLPLDLAMFNLKSGDLVRLSLIAGDNGGHEQIGDEERFILISIHGVDPSARMCLADLQRAARLADALAGNIEAAAKSLQEARQRAGGNVRDPDALTPTRQDLADAASAAALLRPAMLASIAHSDSAALSTALCRSVDAAAVLAGAVERTSARIDAPVQGDLPGRLGPVAARARQLQQDLNTSAQGQLAAALQAQSMDALPRDTAGPVTDVAHRLDQQLHDDAAKLGLNSAAADFPDRLATLIAHETELLSQQHPIDYAQVADGWARRMQEGHPPDSDMSDRLGVGAEAESLRPDSNLVRARDLRLASQAAPAMVTGPAAAQRDQFAPALAAMQRDQSSSVRSDEVHAQADAARAKMAAWAKISATTQPDSKAMDVAMQSNAQMARHDYDGAAKTDQALAKTAAVQRDMANAERIDQIRQEQDRLAAQTASATVYENPQLAARQDSIVQAIRKQDGGADHEDRTSGMVAIGAATTRLSEMPAQLSQALSAAAANRQANQKSAAAAGALAAATQPGNQSAAAAALQQAKQDQAQAEQRQADAAKAVDPAIAQSIAQSLRQSSAAANAAVATIDRQLTPALRQLRQAMDASDAAGTDRAAAMAAAAVAAAQDQLAQANGASMKRDPLASAQYFAQAAASGLSSGGSRAAIAANQRDASLALAQAWQQAAHGAAMGRLGQVPAVAALLNMENPNFTDSGGAESATAWSVDPMPAMRQWGALKNRAPGDISASVNQSDPAGYEESLKAYFEVLNKTGNQP